MTFGKHGTHLNVGIPGSGLSYRTRISPGPSSPSLVAEPANFWVEPPPRPPRGTPGVASIPGTEQEIRSADVSHLTSVGLGDLKRLINEAGARRIELRGQVASAEARLRAARERLQWAEALVIRLFTAGSVPKLVDAANRYYDAHADFKAKLDGCFVEVDFGLDRRARDSYAVLVSAFEGVRSCSRIWDITSTAGIDRVAARTTASTALTRKPVTFEKVQPELVQTSADVLRLGNVNGRPVQIYPGFLMMREPSGDFALIEYGEIECKSAPSNFIEEEGAPADAEQIGATWKYANKNGTPDRRFSNNYQIPVMRYGTMVLSSGKGLAEAYMFSHYERGREFARALNEHKQALRAAESKSEHLALPAPSDDEGDELFDGPAAFSAKPRNNLAVDWLLLFALLTGMAFGGNWVRQHWTDFATKPSEPVAAPAAAEVEEAMPEPAARKPVRRRERVPVDAPAHAQASDETLTADALIEPAPADASPTGDSEVAVSPAAADVAPEEPPR